MKAPIRIKLRINRAYYTYHVVQIDNTAFINLVNRDLKVRVGDTIDEEKAQLLSGIYKVTVMEK